MKSLLWQFVIIATLFCLVAQASQYDTNSKYYPDKYFSPKRTKPSLSIVNPLDVLRQRVMLEMARRQRENAVRQAEANREILKSIGKRGNSFDYDDIEEYLKNRYYERMYQQPSHAGNVEVNKAEPNQHQMPPSQQQQQQPLQGLSQSKTGAKVNDKSKSNEPLQDQIYIFDDGDDNSEDANGEAKQIKNLYRLLSKLTPNDI